MAGTTHYATESEDTSLAAANAVQQMLAYLIDEGYDEQQAHAICSVAVDLKVAEVVDLCGLIVTVSSDCLSDNGIYRVAVGGR